MKCCPLCGTEAADTNDFCINADCKRPFLSAHEKAAAKRAALTKPAPSPTKAEFKSSRFSNGVVGIGLLLLAAVIVAIPLMATEEEFLGSRARRGGFLKLVEQSIGWELFTALLVGFAVWCAIYGIVHLWKALNTTPDVTALPDRLEFHPAVRRSPASYDEISHWSIGSESGNPVLWLHFHEPYWSLQGIYKRRTVKLEGGKREIEPLAYFFADHPVMGGKYYGGR